MKPIYFLFFCFILLFYGCEKVNDNSSELIFNKTWKKGIIDKNPNSNPQGRCIYYAVPECEKDDIYSFNSKENKLTIDKGSVVCSPNEKDETMSFLIDNEHKTLTIGNQKYAIADYSESQIKYYVPMVSATGKDYMIYLLQ